ncbi:hypothetical protein F5876DRAFT_69850 [Lentinula aff. lateritia]|uniref:Uncharacterized protein n=1 Tax=Lentinula aff. lateritia TaxID=2804960 RepID=A0ACC1TKZ1_9AGAR|nr:hypothetical protein F5876DRAFT_69850 [Lentinula aff. lateritia]
MPTSVGTVKSLGASSYILQKNFSFSTALLHAVSFEGTLDYLDGATDRTPTSQLEIPLSFPSLPTTSCSSLLSSPPSSVPSSPLSSAPSSSEILGSTLPEPPLPSTLQLHSSLPVGSAPSQSNGAKRKAKRSKAHGHRNRKKQRQERPPKTADEIGAHPTPVSRFVPDATAVRASFSLASDAPVASTSYVGLHDDGEEGERRTWSLKELVGPRSLHQFSLIEAVPGTTVPIADAERRVIALVVYPDDAGILKCAEEAAELIREEVYVGR